jgi:hypothetical protein
MRALKETRHVAKSTTTESNLQSVQSLTTCSLSDVVDQWDVKGHPLTVTYFVVSIRTLYLDSHLPTSHS